MSSFCLLVHILTDLGESFGMLPHFPNISLLVPPTFQSAGPDYWQVVEQLPDGLVFTGTDLVEEDLHRFEDPRNIICVKSWQDKSNGDIETGTCQFPRPVNLRLGDRRMCEQGLKDLASTLLPSLRSLSTCRVVIRITAAEAFLQLYRAAKNGGCYGGGMSDADSRLSAWNSMFALSGIDAQLSLKPSSRGFLPDILPPLGTVLPLSLLCHRAIYAQTRSIDERLARYFDANLLQLFNQPTEVPTQQLWDLLLCALSLESCIWFTYDSDWHDDMYVGTCWRVGIVCLSTDRQRFSCVSAVDTD